MTQNRRLLALALFLGVALPLAYFLPVRDLLARFLEWTRSLGTTGAVLVAVAYVPASILFLPGSVLTLGAGFAFGVVTGTVAVSIGATLGAASAFLVGRTLARDWVKAKVADNPRFRAIDRAVGREGFRIVFLTRLSPVFPFNLLNYAFGVTDVPFGKYVLASWIGMLPGTLMYVYLGSGLQSLAAVAAGDVEQGGAQRAFFLFGLAITVVVTVWITRLARRALDREAGAEPTTGV